MTYPKRSLALLCAGILATSALSSCTWVKPVEGADQVALIDLADAARCERLGTTTSITASKVGIVDRNDMKVAEEQLTLARNQAVNMGGNAIVEDAESDERAGEKRFIVFACP